MTGTCFEIQLASGEKTSKARDDAGLGVHQDWIVEAKGSDACGDLGDLGVRMGPRISRVGD
jgi:hypothetical protein